VTECGEGHVSRIDPPRRTSRAARAGRRGRQLLALGLVLLVATACSSEDLPRFGMPNGATVESERVAHLWSTGWIAALAVGALVWGLIIWAVIFYRRRSSGLPAQTRYNVPIEALYIIAPFIIIVVFFFFTARDEEKLVDLPANPDQTVNVVGRQWSWTFNYVDGDVWDAGTPGQPPTLYLPVGETVLFELTSPDVIHSFWVVDFLFKMDVIPGKVNKFAVTPNKEGTFSGKCAELCGFDHSRMLFNVKVVSPAAYEAHLAELRSKGQTGQLPEGILPGDPIEGVRTPRWKGVRRDRRQPRTGRHRAPGQAPRQHDRALDDDD